MNLVVAGSVGVHWLASVALVWRTNWSHLGGSVGVVPVDGDLAGGGNGENGENGGQLHFDWLERLDRCFDEDKVWREKRCPYIVDSVASCAVDRHDLRV